MFHYSMPTCYKTYSRYICQLQSYKHPKMAKLRKKKLSFKKYKTRFKVSYAFKGSRKRRAEYQQTQIRYWNLKIHSDLSLFYCSFLKCLNKTNITWVLETYLYSIFILHPNAQHIFKSIFRCIFVIIHPQPDNIILSKASKSYLNTKN